jgi:hypothetical protein
MAATHPENIRNLLADLITAHIDAGSGPGRLRFVSVTGVTVATLQFSRPSFAPAVAGVATAFEILSDPAAIGGRVASAVLLDSDENPVLRCSVGITGAGTAIELSSLDVAVGQEVGLSALSYTAVS